MTLLEQMQKAKQASFRLAATSLRQRNEVLYNIKKALEDNADKIQSANKLDIDAAEKGNLAGSLKKRLALTEAKISSLVKGLEDLINFDDPLAAIDIKRELDEGLRLYRKRVPIGVVGIIFESRPDALVQISSLCLKSGNVAALKGGKEALNTNRTLYELIVSAACKAGGEFRDTVHLIETREEIKQMLNMDKYIDLLIPRGSNSLVSYIKQNTKIPVLGHADGICHLYIDKKADLDRAVELTFDSKCQYPAVCNAIETLLIHKDIAGAALPKIISRLNNVELRGCAKTRALSLMKEAKENDWSEEYNDLVLSIKIVSDINEAVGHINNYGSHHTDSIDTDDEKAAEYFLNNVDSSSVLHNCSTRFADGFRYGFGAEVGISTAKIHARGPVGLEGLTIYKYLLIGSGQTVAPYANGEKKFTHRDIS